MSGLNITNARRQLLGRRRVARLILLIILIVARVPPLMAPRKKMAAIRFAASRWFVDSVYRALVSSLQSGSKAIAAPVLQQTFQTAGDRRQRCNPRNVFGFFEIGPPQVSWISGMVHVPPWACFVSARERLSRVLRDCRVCGFQG